MNTFSSLPFRTFSEMQGGWHRISDTTPPLVRMLKHVRVAHIGALVGRGDKNCEMCRHLTATIQRQNSGAKSTARRPTT